MTDRQTDRQTDRHAYLIMCHHNFDQLKLLLRLLDHHDNDIYLHIDKKVKNVDISAIKAVIKLADIHIIKSFRVNWGGYSQIKVEIALLKEATRSYHKYYHLISGDDLPLCNQDAIHDFFDENFGKEFIRIASKLDANGNLRDRISKYHIFQNMIGRNSGRLYSILYYINHKILSLQKRLNIDRLKNTNIDFYKGANWFSITNDMALFVIGRFSSIKKYMRFSRCADEIFLQTLAMMSPYASRITYDNRRYIDWNRGSPYTFRESDFEELMSSDKLFARKFDSDVDSVIVKKIYTKMIELP